jgi:hypothetical protein
MMARIAVIGVLLIALVSVLAISGERSGKNYKVMGCQKTMNDLYDDADIYNIDQNTLKAFCERKFQ